MKFTCPYCRKECDFMDLQLDGDLRAIIAMSDAFGRHRALVWAYAELFGITPLRAKAKKTRVILESVKKLFDAGGFSYQKRLYAIGIDGIAEALNIVVQRNFADGLDSHNYLKKIMIGISEREGKTAGKQAEKDLRKKEAALMAADRDDRGHVPEARRDRNVSPEAKTYPVPEEQVEAPALKTMPRVHPLTAAEIEERRQLLKSQIESIGRKDGGGI
jgi:hypothetical protein